MLPAMSIEEKRGATAVGAGGADGICFGWGEVGSYDRIREDKHHPIISEPKKAQQWLKMTRQHINLPQLAHTSSNKLRLIKEGTHQNVGLVAPYRKI